MSRLQIAAETARRASPAAPGYHTELLVDLRTWEEIEAYGPSPEEIVCIFRPTGRRLWGLPVVVDPTAIVAEARVVPDEATLAERAAAWWRDHA